MVPARPSRLRPTGSFSSKLVLALVTAFLIALAIYYYGTTRGGSVQSEQLAEEQTRIDLLTPTPTDHVLGNRNASIFLVVYSDTECKFCKRFHTALEGIVADYKSVAMVYRNFPLGIFKRSYFEFQATECAFEQGGDEAFFKYLHTLYEVTPSDDGLDPAELPRIAGEVGLNQTSFIECLEANRNREKIDVHVSTGNLLDARPVPHVFMLIPASGRIYEFAGSRHEAAIRSVIESELSR